MRSQKSVASSDYSLHSAGWLKDEIFIESLSISSIESELEFRLTTPSETAIANCNRRSPTQKRTIEVRKRKYGEEFNPHRLLVDDEKTPNFSHLPICSIDSNNFVH